MKNRSLKLSVIAFVVMSSCTTLDTKDEYAKAALAEQNCMHQSKTEYAITIFDKDDKDNNGKMKTKTRCTHMIELSDIEKQNMEK
ncbi:hypothetical protein [Paraglaciecola sp.]|uniref:hypothetical protein n=1 Tax=Paraglaciecola sp. TaxID=1920173 RepID=UPI003EF186CF